MKRFRFMQLALCLGSLFFSSHEASASDVTLSSDASVNSAHASVNYGALSNLYVGNGNTTFLQFDLTTLPAGATSAQVSHATLTVFVNRVNIPGAVTVSPVTAGWGEYSLTAAGAPATGGSIASVNVTQAGQFISVDVTAQVKAWLDTPAMNNGLALASAGANVLFDSKENDETGHMPLLDVTLVNQGSPGVAGPAGPQGIQGVQGLPGAVGPIGPIGPAGATGATGPAGATGPQGSPVSFQGTWSNATTYVSGDAVFFNGSSYISLVSGNVGHQPDANPVQWSLLAQQGAIGATGPAGPLGSQGVQGIQGPIGAVGPIGPIGTIGPIGPPVSFQGTWSNATTYVSGDAVFFNGSSYISLVSGNVGHQPDANPVQWSLLAQQGAIGATGPAGPLGSQGVQGIQGPIGAVGPIGPIGTIGPIGPIGPPVSFQGTWSNATTYTLGDAVSFNGSSYISLASGNLGFQPDISNVKWGLLAQAGTNGTNGTNGAAGPSGPTGATGSAGPAGPAGANGLGVNSVSFVMQFLNPGVSGTYFISPLYSGNNLTGNTVLGNNFVAMPLDCMMSALKVGVNNYSAPGADITTLTVYKNGVATAMTCNATTNGNGSSCQDQTHTFAVSGGDSISVVFAETNFNPINRVTVGLICQ